MPPYWFFLSYATLDREGAADAFKGFTTDLTNAVRLLVGRADPQTIGFLDRKDIRLGDSWPETLSTALRGSRVLVPLLTPAFFQSDYCRREWDVFHRRQEAWLAKQPPGARRPPIILPVLGVGKTDLPKQLPEFTSTVQFDHESLGEPYTRYGVLQLQRLQRYSDAWHELIQELARRIVQVANQFDVPAAPESFLTEAPEPNGRSATPVGSGPRYVQFVYVAGTPDELRLLRKEIAPYGEYGDDWKPYHPRAEAIAEIATQVAGSEKLYSSPLPLGNGLVEQLQRAKQENRLVAVIVDTWTLRLKPYHELLRPIDEQRFSNCIVVVPWNPDDPETIANESSLKDALTFTFPEWSSDDDDERFLAQVTTPDDLRKRLALALARARARLVTMAQRELEAYKSGIFVKPTISAVVGG